MAAMITKEYLEKIVSEITAEAFTKNKDSIVENIQKNIKDDEPCTTAFSAGMAAFGVEIIRQFNWILIKTLTEIFYDDDGNKLYNLTDEGEITKNECSVK